MEIRPQSRIHHVSHEFNPARLTRRLEKNLQRLGLLVDLQLEFVFLSLKSILDAGIKNNDYLGYYERQYGPGGVVGTPG